MSDCCNIREYFSYDPTTGAFTRLKPMRGGGGQPIGTRADHRHRQQGYRRVSFFGRKYPAHRLAWYFVHGCWPASNIDHKNCDKSDNRIANLRLADQSQNRANSRKPDGLPKGVTFHRGAGRFQARVQAYGKQRYLGLFDTAEAAHAAYFKAATELFGEFARAA